MLSLARVALYDVSAASRGVFIDTLCFQIHWLSIINSMVLVFLLIGFVVIIMVRTTWYNTWQTTWSLQHAFLQGTSSVENAR